jgi:hypothetical protein
MVVWQTVKEHWLSSSLKSGTEPASLEILDMEVDEKVRADTRLELKPCFQSGIGMRALGGTRSSRTYHP